LTGSLFVKLFLPYQRELPRQFLGGKQGGASALGEMTEQLFPVGREKGERFLFSLSEEEKAVYVFPWTCVKKKKALATG